MVCFHVSEEYNWKSHSGSVIVSVAVRKPKDWRNRSIHSNEMTWVCREEDEEEVLLFKFKYRGAYHKNPDSFSSHLISSGIMAVKGGILFLVLLSVSWVYVDAKSSLIPDSLDSGNNLLCTFCQQSSHMVMTYLSSNTTQKMVIDIFKLRCIDLSDLSAECKKLVDYYVPLIFTRITKQLKPGDICRRFQMCDNSEDLMDTLEYSNTQLGIIEILLNMCNTEKCNTEKCKKLVSEHVPMILASAEQFLERSDQWNINHARKTSMDGNGEGSCPAKISMLSES